MRVGAVCVGEQPQAVVQERPSAGVLLVVLAEALLDVRQPGADAVLVSLERREVDGVGEVRGQELVALRFQARPVRGQVRELLIPPGTALVERGIDLGGEVPVVVLADRDVPVGVLDQPFRNLDGYGTAGAGGLLRCAARADGVGVGGAAPSRFRSSSASSLTSESAASKCPTRESTASSRYWPTTTR